MHSIKSDWLPFFVVAFLSISQGQPDLTKRALVDLVPVQTPFISSGCPACGNQNYTRGSDTGLWKLNFPKSLQCARCEMRLSNDKFLLAKAAVFLNTRGGEVLPANTNNFNFNSINNDPRHDFSLSYLLATNKGGAINPNGGEVYPVGAVLKGNLDWNSIQSGDGWAVSEARGTNLLLANTDTLWSPWLSALLGVVYNDYTTKRRPDGGVVTPPLKHKMYGWRGHPQMLPDQMRHEPSARGSQPTERIILCPPSPPDNCPLKHERSSQVSV